jgi:hypothetical protein
VEKQNHWEHLGQLLWAVLRSLGLTKQLRNRSAFLKLSLMAVTIPRS